MKCEDLIDNIPAIAASSMSFAELREADTHVQSCADCRAALRGSEALLEIRRRVVDEPSDGLFERIVETATSSQSRRAGDRRFWLGSAFGGAIAASLFAIAFMFGWAGGGPGQDLSQAQFVVAVGEPRQMDLAFETDRQLDDATISILLSGDVEISGYGLQRELTWSENLDAGVNRLSLPVLASGPRGGQMIVRMTHPLSEQVFVVNLPTES